MFGLLLEKVTRHVIDYFEIIIKKGSRKLPTSLSSKPTLGSLSRDVFERRTSTGSGRFELLSRDFEQIFGQIVSIRITTLSNTNTVASRHIKRERGSLPVDVRRSKTSLLKLPINTYFALRAKCWLRGGVGGQFSRHLIDPKKYREGGQKVNARGGYSL